MSGNDMPGAPPATPDDYGPLCLACGVHMDALWRCPCCEAEHAIPDAPAAPAEGATADLTRRRPTDEEMLALAEAAKIAGPTVEAVYRWLVRDARLAREGARAAPAPAADPDPGFAARLEAFEEAVRGHRVLDVPETRSALVSAWEALRAGRDEAREANRVAAAVARTALRDGDALTKALEDLAAAEARAEAAERERIEALEKAAGRERQLSKVWRDLAEAESALARERAAREAETALLSEIRDALDPDCDADLVGAVAALRSEAEGLARLIREAVDDYGARMPAGWLNAARRALAGPGAGTDADGKETPRG